MAAHDPVWPDKVMSAAMLVQVGGLLAIAFVALRWLDATIDAESLPLLTDWPSAIMVTAGIIALSAGVLAYLHQSWVLVVLGIIANIASLGFLGVSTVIGLVAIVPLVRSFIEGEETRLDRHRMHAHEWPDKAILASTLLAAAACVTLVHGLLTVAGRFETESMPGWAWGGALLATTIVVFVAARQTFHLRRAWLAWAAVVLLIVTAAFYLVGPTLGIVSGIYLWLAEREAEFVDHARPAPS